MSEALADSKVPASIGISQRVWEQLKKDFPLIVSPCAISGNRSFYLRADILAALEANKLKLQKSA
jgi:hypothetical protein